MKARQDNAIDQATLPRSNDLLSRKISSCIIRTITQIKVKFFEDVNNQIISTLPVFFLPSLIANCDATT